MPEDSRAAYDGKFVLLDDEADEVENILGDITTALPTDELTAARLDNIRARTALLEQKIEEQKQSIWNEWNEAVFEEFSTAFARVKNVLIGLHLDEEQIKQLNDGIDDALKSLSDKLDAMWAKFKNGEEEREQ